MYQRDLLLIGYIYSSYWYYSHKIRIGVFKMPSRWILSNFIVQIQSEKGYNFMYISCYINAKDLLDIKFCKLGLLSILCGSTE